MTVTAVRDIQAIVMTIMIVHDASCTCSLKRWKGWQVFAQMGKLIRGIPFLLKVT